MANLHHLSKLFGITLEFKFDLCLACFYKYIPTSCFKLTHVTDNSKYQTFFASWIRKLKSDINFMWKHIMVVNTCCVEFVSTYHLHIWCCIYSRYISNKDSVSLAKMTIYLGYVSCSLKFSVMSPGPLLLTWISFGSTMDK